MSATFGTGPVRLRTAGGAVSLSLAGSPVTSVSARGNRVTLHRSGVREWYVAGPLGIEQGFTLAHRPAGTLGHELTLSSRSAALRVHERPLDRAINFMRLARRIAVTIRGTHRGRRPRGHRLSAALRVSGGRVLVSVNDRGARYPITVDPLVQQGAKLTASGESGRGSSASARPCRRRQYRAGRWRRRSRQRWRRVGVHAVGRTWSQQGPKLTGGGARRRVRLERGAVSGRQHAPWCGADVDGEPGRGVGVHAIGVDMDTAGGRADRSRRDRRRRVRLRRGPVGGRQHGGRRRAEQRRAAPAQRGRSAEQRDLGSSGVDAGRHRRERRRPIRFERRAVGRWRDGARRRQQRHHRERRGLGVHPRRRRLRPAGQALPGGGGGHRRIRLQRRAVGGRQHGADRGTQ